MEESDPHFSIDTLTIHNGNITAISLYYGADIGIGGMGESDAPSRINSVTIMNGKITAIASFGSGIGAGGMGEAGILKYSL